MRHIRNTNHIICSYIHKVCDLIRMEIYRVFGLYIYLLISGDSIYKYLIGSKLLIQYILRLIAAWELCSTPAGFLIYNLENFNAFISIISIKINFLIILNNTIFRNSTEVQSIHRKSKHVNDNLSKSHFTELTLKKLLFHHYIVTFLSELSYSENCRTRETKFHISRKKKKINSKTFSKIFFIIKPKSSH